VSQYSFPILITILLMGCTKSYQSDLVTDEVDPIVVRLEQSAEDASKALKTLAMVSQARTKPADIKEPEKLPAELKRRLTLAWTGPAEFLLEVLAKEVGYSFDTYGRAPVSPIIARIKVDRKPAYKILKDVGFQMGDRGVLHIEPYARSIELRYETK